MDIIGLAQGVSAFMTFRHGSFAATGGRSVGEQLGMDRFDGLGFCIGYFGESHLFRAWVVAKLHGAKVGGRPAHAVAGPRHSTREGQVSQTLYEGVVQTMDGVLAAPGGGVVCLFLCVGRVYRLIYDSMTAYCRATGATSE